MKPAPFVLRRPTTIDEAVTHLVDDDLEIKVIAGGQSLMALLNLRLTRFDVLVDLNRVSELSYVDVEDGTLRIGAMARQRTIELDPAVIAGWPALAGTLPFVAHAPIRNRGTMGGSLAHADPAAELCAVALALDATVVARSARGIRDIPIGEFFDGPYTTTLQPDEILAEIRIPATSPATGWAFEEMTRRKGDFAMVGVIAIVRLADDGSIADSRLAYISMGMNAFRSAAGEQELRGAEPGEQTFRRAAAAAVAGMHPSDHAQASAAFRKHLAGVLTRRALAKAYSRAQQDREPARPR